MVEAKDLMKKDISVLGKGKSDPYAIVTVGSQQFRTQTIDSTVNPKWDYWCEVCHFCVEFYEKTKKREKFVFNLCVCSVLFMNS